MAKEIKPKKMKVADLKQLIDEGKELDFNIKEQNRRMAEIKEKIKAHAMAVKRHQLDGNFGTCVFVDDTTEWLLDVSVAHGWAMSKKVKNEKFFGMLKVLVSEARKLMGDEEFESIATKKDKNFSRITFGEVEMDTEGNGKG